MVTTKVCPQCGLEKELTEEYWPRAKGRKDGFYGWCKPCSSRKSKIYAQNNSDMVRAKNYRRYHRNREEILARKAQYYRDHIEERRAYFSGWYQKNYDTVKANVFRYKCRKRNADGFFTGPQWSSLKQAYCYKCLRCGKTEPEIKLVPDHVIPLSVGGSNYIDNIQPLCESCNNWKRAKTIDYRSTDHNITVYAP